MKTIVLTAGGARGAFSAGVISNLMDKGTYEPDSYFGISSGALVSGLFSQIDSNAIEDTITQIKSRKNLFSFNWGLLWSPGLFTSRPLECILRHLFKTARLKPNDRKPAYLAYTDISKGELIYKNINELKNVDEIIETILHAVSIPGFLKPFKMPYVDAGCLEINPVSYAISLGKKDVTLIFERQIMANTFNGTKGYFQTAQLAMRSLDLMMHRMAVDDLAMGYMYEDGVAVDIIEPKTHLGEALDFDRSAGFYGIGKAGQFTTTKYRNL
jgi:predicted acylesterase/phospholipase RssA